MPIKPTALCNNLKKQVDMQSKYLLIKQAIIDNDLSVLKEIKLNYANYQSALYDSNTTTGKNFLHLAIKHNAPEYCYFLVSTHLFKGPQHFCYTEMALNNNETNLALFLYEKGYKQEDKIKKYFNNDYTQYTCSHFFNQIIPKWIENNESVSLPAMFKKDLYELFSNNLSYFENQILTLPEKTEGFFNAVEVNSFSSEKNAYYTQMGTFITPSTENKVKFAFHVLKLIAQKDKHSIDENTIFSRLITMINRSTYESPMKKYLSIAMEFYPQKLDEMIELSTNHIAKSFLEKEKLNNALMLNINQTTHKIKL